MNEEEDKYIISHSGPMGSSEQQTTAAAFFARARNKLPNSPAILRPENDKKEEETTLGTEVSVTNFTNILNKCPPPVPSSLLKKMEGDPSTTGLSPSSPSTSSSSMGKVRVIVRVANSGLIDEKKGSFFCMDKKKRQVTLFDPAKNKLDQQHVVSAPKMFAFDGLFTDEDDQGDIAAAALTDTIQSVVNGTDACLFCFGHANLGKTYTMIGSDESSKTLGVIPTAITWLFKCIKEKKEKSDAKFSVRISAMEIGTQKEEINDLLANHNDNQMPPPSAYFPKHQTCHSVMQNLTELRCQTQEKAAQYLDSALSAQAIGAEPGEPGKDSHFVFTLHVYQYSVDKSNQQRSSVVNNVVGGRSRLHLIDFGSCERMRTQNGGITLSALGHVILGIFNGQRHLPFKESPVTLLLKECLSSLSCQATMLAHISPSPSHYSETLHTAQLASRIHRMRRKKTKCSGSGGGGSGSGSSDDAGKKRGGMSSSDLTATSTDPSSSEQSCDTVIYVGDRGNDDDDDTDAEHPPVYLPNLNSGDNRGLISKVLRGSILEQQQSHHRRRSTSSTLERQHNNHQRSSPILSNREILHSPQKMRTRPGSVGSTPTRMLGCGGLNSQRQQQQQQFNAVNHYSLRRGGSLPRNPKGKMPLHGKVAGYRKELQQQPMSFEQRNENNVVEYWIDQPQVLQQAQQGYEARKVLCSSKDDCVATGEAEEFQSHILYGYMDEHKKSMIQKWVECQQAEQYQQSLKDPKNKNKKMIPVKAPPSLSSSTSQDLKDVDTPEPFAWLRNGGDQLNDANGCKVLTQFRMVESNSDESCTNEVVSVDVHSQDQHERQNSNSIGPSPAVSSNHSIDENELEEKKKMKVFVSGAESTKNSSSSTEGKVSSSIGVVDLNGGLKGMKNCFDDNHHKVSNFIGQHHGNVQNEKKDDEEEEKVKVRTATTKAAKSISTSVAPKQLCEAQTMLKEGRKPNDDTFGACHSRNNNNNNNHCSIDDENDQWSLLQQQSHLMSGGDQQERKQFALPQNEIETTTGEEEEEEEYLMVEVNGNCQKQRDHSNNNEMEKLSPVAELAESSSHSESLKSDESGSLQKLSSFDPKNLHYANNNNKKQLQQNGFDEFYRVAEDGIGDQLAKLHDLYASVSSISAKSQSHLEEKQLEGSLNRLSEVLNGDDWLNQLYVRGLGSTLSLGAPMPNQDSSKSHDNNNEINSDVNSLCSEPVNLNFHQNGDNKRSFPELDLESHHFNNSLSLMDLGFSFQHHQKQQQQQQQQQQQEKEFDKTESKVGDTNDNRSDSPVLEGIDQELAKYAKLKDLKQAYKISAVPKSSQTPRKKNTFENEEEQKLFSSSTLFERRSDHVPDGASNPDLNSKTSPSSCSSTSHNNEKNKTSSFSVLPRQQQLLHREQQRQQQQQLSNRSPGTGQSSCGSEPESDNARKLNCSKRDEQNNNKLKKQTGLLKTATVCNGNPRPLRTIPGSSSVPTVAVASADEKCDNNSAGNNSDLNHQSPSKLKNKVPKFSRLFGRKISRSPLKIGKQDKRKSSSPLKPEATTTLQEFHEKQNKGRGSNFSSNKKMSADNATKSFPSTSSNCSNGSKEHIQNGTKGYDKNRKSFLSPKNAQGTPVGMAIAQNPSPEITKECSIKTKNKKNSIPSPYSYPSAPLRRNSRSRNVDTSSNDSGLGHDQHEVKLRTNGSGRGAAKLNMNRDGNENELARKMSSKLQQRAKHCSSGYESSLPESIESPTALEVMDESKPLQQHQLKLHEQLELTFNYPLLDPLQVVQYEEKEVKRLDTRWRFQTVNHLKSVQNDLKIEMAKAKERIGADPKRWSYELHLEESGFQDKTDPAFVEAFGKETEILQKRVNACKSHVKMMTCFDVKPLEFKTFRKATDVQDELSPTTRKLRENCCTTDCDYAENILLHLSESPDQNESDIF